MKRFKNAFHSLRNRILLSAILIIVVVLPVIGMALNNAFEQQLRLNLQEQLKAYFYSILAVTDMDKGELMMPEVLLENQFNVINSGLYALVSSSTQTLDSGDHANILWSSNSFLDMTLDTPLPAPELGEAYFAELPINQQSHYIYSYSVQFDSASRIDDALSAPITLHIISDVSGLKAQQQSFAKSLWSWLLLLMATLLLIQFCWLVWTLNPLKRFTQELKTVQSGQTQKLSEDYPSELQTVAKQLNTLLINEQAQRKRYRNALSDLAHSLKTPLAAISSQADLTQDSIDQIAQINRTISHQLKRAQSAGEKAWHLGFKLSESIDKLLRSFTKIYPHIDLTSEMIDHQGFIFKGDEVDVMEMLGNLLDNACKAAASQVKLKVFQREATLCISVEDDGKGVSPAQKSSILARGTRADTYEQGHGIGLAIVCDIVKQYSGSLEIDNSAELGGATFTLCFTQQ